jgi:hypothetical protein
MFIPRANVKSVEFARASGASSTFDLQLFLHDGSIVEFSSMAKEVCLMKRGLRLAFQRIGLSTTHSSIPLIYYSKAVYRPLCIPPACLSVCLLVYLCNIMVNTTPSALVLPLSCPQEVGALQRYVAQRGYAQGAGDDEDLAGGDAEAAGRAGEEEDSDSEEVCDLCLNTIVFASAPRCMPRL